MRLDLGKLAQSHQRWQFGLTLDRCGFDAIVYEPQVAENGYEALQPEMVTNRPSFYCKVLLGQPYQGLRITNYISVSDKMTTQMVLSTDKIIKDKSRVVVKMQDGKTINLLVVNVWQFDIHTSIIYKYDVNVLIEDKDR